MDRENTPLKQRQKRGGGSGSRRSSTSSIDSSSAAVNQSRGTQQSTAVSAFAAPTTASGGGNGAANTGTGGASARAFRSGNTRTRAKAASASSASANAIGSGVSGGGSASSTAAPAMILAKHPLPPPQPTILRTSGVPTAAMAGLYIPDAPAAAATMRSSPPSASIAHGRYSDGSVGYLHVNTRQQQQQQISGAHPQLYSAQSRHSTGGGDGPVRTLYQPPPSSSPSVKKLAPSPQSAAPLASSALMRPQTPSALAAAAAASHPSTIVAPTSSVKLISSQYQFATDLSSKLSGCLELTNFTVVGTLGFEGVGKSTLLSLLHRSSESSEPPPSVARQWPAAPATASRATSSSTTTNIFATQSFETLLAGGHETSGVDLAVLHESTGTSLVLLDTQPMLSSAMLCDLLSKSESQPRFGAAALTPEQQLEVHSYQLATFILSICHYVVIAHDALADLQVVRFLQHVEARLQSCRLPHISGAAKDKHVAKLLFVATRVPDAALLYREQTLLARHVRALELAWPGAFYRTSRPVSLFRVTAHESENTVQNHHQQQQQQQEQHIPVFVLPPKPSAASSGAAAPRCKYEDYDDAAARWQRFVQRLPNAPSFSKNSATHHAMSLREWLSNASRVFDAVRKSSAFTAEFHHLSARDHY